MTTESILEEKNENQENVRIDQYKSLILGKQLKTQIVNPEFRHNILENQNIPWPELPEEEMLKAFNKIPAVDEEVKKLKIVIDDGQEYLPRINKDIAHKRKKENVIITEPEKYGNMWYFNMIPETEEFKFDHPSDHVQGMLIVEGVRQCGIATTHLCGLPTEGRIILSNLTTTFNSYVKAEHPIILRAVSRPVVFTTGQFKQYVLINVIQFGKICACSIIEGLAFSSKKDYLAYGSKIDNIVKRVQYKYSNSLSKLKSND